ncbi:MAG TPA: PEGA domain-containing protein [Longimicrobium sp.]|jgi:uncharacterized protein YceK
MRIRLLAVLTLTATAGCATIMHGSKQEVGFSSNPTGATIFVNNQQVGVTPTTVSLKRKDQHTVRMELQGYQPFEMQLSRGTSGWVWGNLVFGGLPGLVVDALTGAIYKINPDNVQGTLTRATASLDGDTLHIAVVLSADPSWEKIGQLAPAGGW